MSKMMEDLSVYESRFNFVIEDKPKVAKMSKGKSKMPGRKALANISNTQQGCTASNQDYKSESSSDVLRKHIEQLQKEKTALMKHLADKNKLIELGGNEMQRLRVQNSQLSQSNSQIQAELNSAKEREKAALMKHLADKNKLIELGRNEMQRLRVTLEKLKQQNLQFAQSNSQIQAELNSAKERLKVLNHELGCKNGLIIAKNLELEEKNKIIMHQANDGDHNKVTEPEETEVCKVAEGDDHNQISKSSVYSNEKFQDNDKGKSRRLQTRRQSAKFKLDEPKPTQDSLKMNNIDDISLRTLPDYNAADDHGGDDILKVNDSNSGTSSSKMEDAEGDFFQDDNNHQQHRKTSLSRPVREAAKKVQSYKEVNLVVKMRRD